MPVIQTKGAMSSQGLGEFSQTGVAAYIEDVFSTYLYTGNGTYQTINNGIALGNGFAADGVSGGSGVFASGSCLTTTLNSSGVSLTGDMTFEGWMYPTSYSNNIVFAVGTTSGQRILFQLYNNQAYVYYGNITSSKTTAQTQSSYLLNSWHHFAVVRNGNDVHCYIDGIDQGSYGTITVDPTGYNTIIADIDGTGSVPFDGNLSNVRFTKAALYTSSFIPPLTALTASANTGLLICQGATPFVDNSGNGFSITQVNSPTASSVGPYPITQITGEGGLVWIKSRSAATDNFLFDTERGALYEINSNTTDASTSLSDSLTNFNADGFSIGSATGIGVNTATYASWTFAQQPKFFDVVTWTGNGSNRTIAHNLGGVPGCIIVKRTDTTSDWQVYHRSLTSAAYGIQLNLTNAQSSDSTLWNSTAPTRTVFSLGTNVDVNANGGTYVAYLFAHDAGGFGLSGTDNVISCGSFTTDGSGDATVSLGWEPQWLLVKRTDLGGSTARGWYMVDSMRGMPAPPGLASYLMAQNSDAESANNVYLNPYSTGFSANLEASGTYIYIAIRRGPMRTPTSGTSVFTPSFSSAAGGTKITTGFPVDLQFTKITTSSVDPFYWVDRLRGTNSPGLSANVPYINSSNTNAETAGGGIASGWDNTGYTIPGLYALTASAYWSFARAPGFFDEVCYTGTGSATTQAHNLGVVPELMIVKNRSDATGRAWAVYAGDATDYLVLNTTAATADDATYWNDTAPTASVFSVGTNNSTNESGDTFVAYLFASCPGVSKVGSFTGTGATLQVNCGFTGGARFVLIKATSTTGDWLVWDSARGIVAGNDPYLALNSTAAEVTTTDWVDTYSAGFELSNASGNLANTNGTSYIFLAVS